MVRRGAVAWPRLLHEGRARSMRVSNERAEANRWDEGQIKSHLGLDVNELGLLYHWQNHGF